MSFEPSKPVKPKIPKPPKEFRRNADNIAEELKWRKDWQAWLLQEINDQNTNKKEKKKYEKMLADINDSITEI